MKLNKSTTFSSAAAIGTLVGLIGLGGAEFRLPLLIAFRFAALEAIILNKAISLIVVASFPGVAGGELLIPTLNH